jgi:protein-S-isoprenylcysteine O-methyltransferase Ste14
MIRAPERVFLWTAGAAFVAALAYCVYTYLIVWGAPGPFRPAAIVRDVALVSLFACHHSVFARDPFKRWVARLVVERRVRSVYVFVASLLLVLVCAWWQPVGGALYRITGWRAVIHGALQWIGVAVIARSVAGIDPLELAGIRPPSSRDVLQTSGPYRWVRHPLYLGWLFATFGAANMTGDRLTFAAATAIYLAVAIPWEERSLVRQFGTAYAEYQRHVRWRIVPYVY